MPTTKPEFYKKEKAGDGDSEYFNDIAGKNGWIEKKPAMEYSADTVSNHDIRASQQLFLIWYPQVGQASSKAHL